MSKFCKICEKLNPNQLLKVCSYACDSKYQEQNPKKKKIQKPIPRRSKKRANQEVVYMIKRKKYMDEHKICERCFNEPSEVCHHKKGRIGDLLTDERYFMALSTKCHDHIHNHPTEAYANGWMLNRNI